MEVHPTAQICNLNIYNEISKEEENKSVCLCKCFLLKAPVRHFLLGIWRPLWTKWNLLFDTRLNSVEKMEKY